MAGAKKKSGGARIGAGRKKKSDEAELQRLLDKAWPAKKRLETIRKFADRAAMGDLESFRLLMAYKYGKPKEKHEHSGPDGGDIPINLTAHLLKAYGDGDESGSS